MDFGKVEISELSIIDFTLAKDSVFTNATLKASKPTGMPQVYIGCAKWGRKEWVGDIYPEKTKEAEFLGEYVKHFNSVELNATHYKMPDVQSIIKWSAKANEIDFKFCPKVPKGISHFGNLAPSPNLDRQTKDFIIAVSAFEEKLGPVFLQLSDKFLPAKKDNLFSYLKTIPKDLSFFLEVRHPDWFSDKSTREEFLNVLRENNIGAVITDTSGRRDLVHMNLTIPKAFIRFVGNNLHPTDYTRIVEWAKRIKTWLDKGLQEVYFFMHHTDEKNSPVLCDYAIEQINQYCGTEIGRVRFINQKK
ncbi:MAG: DUF72 domain-containing protein [Ginsengibacter sp.]